MNPVCPAHGSRNIQRIEAVTINGMTDPAMLVCVACMEDGASPMGAWSWELPAIEVKAKGPHDDCLSYCGPDCIGETCEQACAHGQPCSCNASALQEAPK